MLRIKGLLFIFAVVAIFVTATIASNVKYVNPLFGTDRPSSAEYGGMIPSTGTPFGMTRWTPFTQENYVGSCPYLYAHDMNHGFLATHQPAVWMGESAEVSIAVGTGPVQTSFASRGLKFSHADEISTPQYYKVKLQTGYNDQNITAEMTATSRVGRLRFVFDSIESNFAVLQVTRSAAAARAVISGEVFIDPVSRQIYGYNPERQDSVLGPFTASDFKGYFVAQFDQDFAEYGIAHGNDQLPMVVAGHGSDLSAYVTFKSGGSANPVNVKVGVSYISYEQARKNIESEAAAGSTFEETVNYVEELWTEKLDLITLHNATEEDASVFYTSMYHALQYPNEMFEKNESGRFYYSGFDNAVHEGEAYTGYSIWDTFRAEWSFLNMFAPERINGMIKSMLQTYQQGGRLPIWQNIVETNIMIGTHSSSLIAESLAKGFSGFDLDLAWEALLKDAEVPPDNDLTTMYYDREEGTACEARAGLTREKELGYVAATKTSEAGSRTLEYAYDDYTVGKFAELTNRPDEAAKYFARSKYYQNIFNNDTMMMEARYENGTWCPLPATWTEADDWVYTFNVFHDFPGLRELFRGADAFAAKLDAYYEGGHNDQTNEPSHATVFAYLYANQPWKAQSMIRKLMKENYFPNPIGLSGNEDCGQMSAWYIYNALGFYPVNPASGKYIIGTPLFDKIEVKFPPSPSNTKVASKLIITASGAANKMYVKGVTLNGKVLNSPEVTHSQVMGGLSLTFEMSDEPQKWAVGML